MSEIMLKPCPFCGKETTGAPTFEGVLYKLNTHEEPGVYCPNCGAIGPNDVSYERADEMWNLRRPEEALRDRIVQLEAHLKDRDAWLKNNRDYIGELEKKNIALNSKLSTAETNTAANTIFMAQKEVYIAQLKATAADDKFKIMCLERRVKELEAEVKSRESTR